MKLFLNQPPFAVAFQSLIFFQVLLDGTHSSLLEMVLEIAAHENATDQIGTNVCIFTNDNSSLDMISPLLLPTLLQTYPTVFLSKDLFVDTERRWLANVVVLDLTAYHEEFPFKFIQQRLNYHPCYMKTAKFVILMGGNSFSRKDTALQYLKKYAILNFVLVPVPENSTSDTLNVYTWNQYTQQEHYFRTTDRPVETFFPDKLRNLNGYLFTMHGTTNYPYMVFDEERDGVAYGLVPNLVNHVIRLRCNGTTYYTEELKYRLIMDANFNVQDERYCFINTFYFREETGIYLICPIHPVRDILRHLLKPFSLGIWVAIGGLFALCRVAMYLFPHIFRYDLIALTFFGGGGVEYLQPFAFRIVTLTLAVLIFFLSEAYNTKIISLMSLSKFNKEPQTIDEVIQSDLRIMSARSGTELFGPIAKNFLSYPASERAHKRYGYLVYQHYCGLMYKGNAWIAISNLMMDLKDTVYMVPEPLMMDKLLIQLSQHSPFFDLFQRIFGWLNECGVWSYLMYQANSLLFYQTKVSSIQEQFQEVIFFFDDLACVWILILVGWLLSSLCFVGELARDAWKERRRRRVTKKFKTVRNYRLIKAWLQAE